MPLTSRSHFEKHHAREIVINGVTLFAFTLGLRQKDPSQISLGIIYGPT